MKDNPKKTNKNSISYFVGKRKLFSLLCAVLLCVSCTKLPKINEAARQEAETLAKDATASYEKSQKSVSFANKYSWQVDVDDAKTRSGKFLAAAKDLELARDKFLQASTKIAEAMNGQTSFDSDEARYLWQKSRGYKAWSDMAEFERTALQDAAAMTDTKTQNQKLTVAQEKRDEMNKELMAIMKYAN